MKSILFTNGGKAVLLLGKKESKDNGKIVGKNISVLFHCIFFQFYVGKALDVRYGSGIDLGTWTGCWTHVRDCINGFSVTLWLKPNSQPTDNYLRGIVSTITAYNTNGFAVYYIKDSGVAKIGFTVRDYVKDKAYSIEGPFTDTGKWTHYTFTCNFPSTSQGPTLIGFKNSNIFPDLTRSSITKSYQDNDCNRLVSGWYFIGDAPFTYSLSKYADVVIDDIFIFEGVLSESEAGQAMNLITV